MQCFSMTTWSFLLFLFSDLVTSSTSSADPEPKPEPKPLFHHGSRVKRLPDIYWNTSNPIFRIDNTDHIMDVNEGSIGSTFDYDQVNIICPLYDSRLTPNEMDTEKYIIYHVNKEEFETCRIMSAHPRIIANCDKPYSLRYFTISFRSFSPTPGALEFHPGKDYYFISTSSQSDLHRRVDGMCRSHNMKMVFKVAEKKKLELAPPGVTANTIDGKSLAEKQEPTHKKRRKEPMQSETVETKKDIFGELDDTLPTFRSHKSEHVVVDEEKERDIFPRKEPKSLDYYLYQTRSNPHPNLVEDEEINKRISKNNGSVKQEASTSNGNSNSLAELLIIMTIFLNVVVVRL